MCDWYTSRGKEKQGGSREGGAPAAVGARKTPSLPPGSSQNLNQSETSEVHGGFSGDILALLSNVLRLPTTVMEFVPSTT